MATWRSARFLGGPLALSCALALVGTWAHAFNPGESLAAELGDDCTNHDTPPVPIGAEPSTYPPNGLPPLGLGNPGGRGGPSPAGYQPVAGDPVALSAGYPYNHIVDVSLPVRGELFFGIQRTYGEGENGSTQPNDIPVGANWHLSADMRLFQLSGGDDLLLRDHMGRLRFFHPDTDYLTGDVRYYSQLDQGLYAYIERVGTQGFDVTYNGGIVQHFSAGGRLERTTDRNGNMLLFSYSNGRLDRIANNADGRELRFVYHTSGFQAGHLWKVTDESGAALVTYGYTQMTNPFDPENPFVALTSVSPAGGSQTTYHYATYHTPGGPSDPFGLLRLDTVREDGEVVVTYPRVGDTLNENYPRAEIRDPGGTLLLDYISSTDFYYCQTYRIWDNGQMPLTTVTTNWARDVLRVETDGVVTTSNTYLSAGPDPGTRPSQRLISVRQTPAGPVTYEYSTIAGGCPPTYSGYSAPWQHFAQGNCVAVIYPDEQFELYTYSQDKFNVVTSWQDTLGLVTQYFYDDRGNLIRILHPDGSEETFTYDEWGQLIGQADPASPRTLLARRLGSDPSRGPLALCPRPREAFAALWPAHLLTWEPCG